MFGSVSYQRPIFKSFINIVFCTGAFLLIARCSSTPLNCQAEIIQTRKIIKSSIEIVQLWGRTGIYLENFEKSLPMVSTSELLITAQHGCNEVTAFHLDTGEIVWKTPQDDPEKGEFTAINYPDNLALDYARDQIYVSGFGEIRAIAVFDGRTIWRNVSNEFERNAHRVVINEDGQLTVNANRDWYIDPNSGVLSDLPIVIENTTSDFVATVDHQVSLILSKLSGYSVISNYVKQTEIIYVLDSNAKLHLLDANNGTEIGIIEFDQPKKTDLLYEPGAIGGSWLAVEEDILAIYFQDTDVLSVYKFNSPQ
jgi:hypothetical protein